ncbi:MAG TPA: outer membrane protein transport protein [Solidesulfovibrio sp.]|nr:outer membrane protein transport protein [Solidesulfovibrio sp.]
MKAALTLCSLLSCLALLAPSFALATNGDNLIGVGSASRAMGGVGIASPQDSISAVFANPAAMCFSRFCPSSGVDFMGTIFMPHVKSSVTAGGVSVSSSGKDKVYAIPALGISFGLEDLPRLRFGLGAYGVSGLGVDYKDRGIDQKGFFGSGMPMASGTYTDLSIMKFAPSVAYQVTDWLSVGAALHVDYSTLDLGNGSSSGYGIGGQFGLILKPVPQLSFGMTYVTPQPVTYDQITDFDGDGRRDSLVMESPQQFGFGLSYEFLSGTLLAETDIKWINWSNAQGYKEFDWSDQWVFSLGLQYKPIEALSIRAGYNYGQNPVRKHSINGSQMVGVQGKRMPSYYYESFRVIGFPAIAEHHLTCGVSYDLTKRFTAHVGYMRAFENSITEHGTDLMGMPARFRSSLSEDSFEVGLSWFF